MHHEASVHLQYPEKGFRKRMAFFFGGFGSCRFFYKKRKKFSHFTLRKKNFFFTAKIFAVKQKKISSFA